MTKPVIQRVWAMPSKNTFDIKPIKELINRYINEFEHTSNYISVDPFAN